MSTESFDRFNTDMTSLSYFIVANNMLSVPNAIRLETRFSVKSTRCMLIEATAPNRLFTACNYARHPPWLIYVMFRLNLR